MQDDAGRRCIVRVILAVHACASHEQPDKLRPRFHFLLWRVAYLAKVFAWCLVVALVTLSSPSVLLSSAVGLFVVC